MDGGTWASKGMEKSSAALDKHVGDLEDATTLSCSKSRRISPSQPRWILPLRESNHRLVDCGPYRVLLPNCRQNMLAEDAMTGNTLSDLSSTLPSKKMHLPLVPASTLP